MIGVLEHINEFSSPLLATAIHCGHEIRPGLEKYMSINEMERLREEDPYTNIFTAVFDNRITVNTSRFEVDLNRSRQDAIYRTEGQSWGLKVWHENVPLAVWEYSLGEYDYFYGLLGRIIRRFIDYWGFIIIYDIHSYNYRRQNRKHEQADDPDINVGTGTLDRQLWAPVADAFIGSLQDVVWQGRRLSIAENIKFKGGYMAYWIHSQFPQKSCVLSIELKKIFMDEWTGVVDLAAMKELIGVLQSTITPVMEAASAIHSK